MQTAECLRLTVTAADADRFTRRLERWSAALPPREQALLARLLYQAAAAPPADVQGFLVDARPEPREGDTGGPLTLTFFPGFGGGIRVPLP
jgi:hypothetical protein